MEEHNLRTVGEVADLVGVSVRTLHHWDAIGLVSPQWRSWADYRLYSEEDVARIYQTHMHSQRNTEHVYRNGFRFHTASMC